MGKLMGYEIGDMERLTGARALAVLMCFILVSGQGPVQVTTDLGVIEGTYQYIDKSKINLFKKIPFAQPPTGELRFRKPVPVQPWAGILKATAFGPSCIQDIPAVYVSLLENKEISEDCLHLNIYVPNEVSSTLNKTVMVWIHGGGFMNGQASLYDGSYLALQGDVIVVTINYRLGILGFLSTSDDSSAGNFGLWDQIEALKWIKKNIKSFGGNPNSVTIFGESAGGWSVAYLATMPQNRGLFNRVVMQSGAFSSHVTLTKQPYKAAATLALLMRCIFFKGSASIVTCLRSKDALSIKSMQNLLLFKLVADTGIFSVPIGPVVDNDLIHGDTLQSLNNETSDVFSFFTSLDIMAGCTSGDGSVATYTVLPYLATVKGFNSTVGVPSSVLSENFAPQIAQVLYHNKTEVAQAIVDKFSSNDNEIQAMAVVDMYADILFYVPTIQAVNIHSLSNSKTKTFMYLFSEDPPINIGSALPPWFKGSPHTAEIIYLFGLKKLPFIGIGYSAAHLELSETMLTYWTNFAKFGDPNSGSLLKHWPEYDTVTKKYINLDNPIKVEKNLYRDRMEFWMRSLPQIVRGEISGAIGMTFSFILTSMSALVTCLLYS